MPYSAVRASDIRQSIRFLPPGPAAFGEVCTTIDMLSVKWAQNVTKVLVNNRKFFIPDPSCNYLSLLLSFHMFTCLSPLASLTILLNGTRHFSPRSDRGVKTFSTGASAPNFSHNFPPNLSCFPLNF